MLICLVQIIEQETGTVVGNWILTPSQPFRLYQGKTQFNNSQVKKSFHSFRHFTVFVWGGFGENRVEQTGKAKISRLEMPAVGKAC